jgi:hypothetical protein
MNTATSPSRGCLKRKPSVLRLCGHSGTPEPEAQDRRCEGVADFVTRRARVWQALFFTERLTAEILRAQR